MGEVRVICEHCGLSFFLLIDDPEEGKVFGVCPYCGLEEEHSIVDYD